jgi:hypothetical protein
MWLVVGIIAVISASSLNIFYLEAQLGNGIRTPIHVACVGDRITSDTQYPIDLGMLLGSSYVLIILGLATQPLLFNSISVFYLNFKKLILILCIYN